tara:strand:+ start:68 stop:496 length:429 start_codon:yes stop_codon:yes gene_type:complete
LQRHGVHDGLAVVNQPDGYGIHIVLETNTSDKAVCQPHWLPDAARLFNGNGTVPFSSSLANRNGFFQAVARGDVLRTLQSELKHLCALRAPQSRWTWTNPPRSEAEVIPVEMPALEEEDLLANPAEELKRLKELIKNQPDAL